jgi:DNA-binding winged helix-turn-helix (wHTH) protein/TolB-like protein
MTYRFGVYEFDDRAAILTRAGRAVALEPQPARALALLLSRAGGVVRRDELIAHLWGDDTHVDFDRGLAYCIGQLRAAVGESADNPRFIQTLPRRGFRFIAPVDSSNGADVLDASLGVNPLAPPTPRTEPMTLPTRRGPATLATAAAVSLSVAGAFFWAVAYHRAPPRPIVAVATFSNETGDASREPVVAALSDVIVERLTALGPDRIGVNGNASVLRRPRDDRDPRTVARDTHASFLVYGSLTKRNGRLSLLVQIVKLDDGTHVWVQRFSRPLDDALESLGDDLAAQVETAVRAIVLKGAPNSPHVS